METITKVGEVKISSKGSKYRQLEVVGKWCGWFPKSEEELDMVKPGDKAELRTVGKYVNVLRVEFTPTEHGAPEEFVNGNEVNDRRSLDILRGQCLNIAGNVWAKSGESYRASDILKFAKELFEEAKKQEFLLW